LPQRHAHVDISEFNPTIHCFTSAQASSQLCQRQKYRKRGEDGLDA
jgi:hypothetical protein